jgi:predicted RNA-binding Zn-ribbon protein involved in translation (DUF1610 family)
MTRVRSGTTKNVVLISVAIVLFVIAGVYALTRGSGIEPAPDDRFVAFHCEACGEDFQYSDREFEGVFDRREYRTRKGTRERPGTGGLVFKCPKCGEFAAVRVANKGASPSGSD